VRVAPRRPSCSTRRPSFSKMTQASAHGEPAACPGRQMQILCEGRPPLRRLGDRPFDQTPGARETAQSGKKPEKVGRPTEAPTWNLLHASRLPWRVTPSLPPWPGTAPSDVMPDGTVPFRAELAAQAASGTAQRLDIERSPAIH